MLSRNWRHVCRRYSQTVNFRTSENSPAQHNEKQEGLFYTINPDLCKQLFAHGGFPRTFMKQTKTFTETAIMVRQPALDLMDCIKASDMSQPVIRYVLYGDKGTGKSITLAHLLHYAHEDGYLIVHVPWVSEWLRRVPRHKEMSNSQTHEGFVDLPLDAAAWLIHFKSQNQTLLKSGEKLGDNTILSYFQTGLMMDPNGGHGNSDNDTTQSHRVWLKTSKEYVWSKRETTVAGSSLAALVEHGISRVKYACDVVDALVDEIKILSNSKQCKTFVAIDGFNSFFYPLTRLNTPTKRKVKPEEVTLTTSFMKLTTNDWHNGAIVLTADQLAFPDDHQESHFPRYLLYKKGFEHLDPFVPIEVCRYNDKEFISCVNYYRDRLWLRGPPEVETELKFTSASNPYRFMEQCAPL